MIIIRDIGLPTTPSLPTPSLTLPSPPPTPTLRLPIPGDGGWPLSTSRAHPDNHQWHQIGTASPDTLLVHVLRDLPPYAQEGIPYVANIQWNRASRTFVVRVNAPGALPTVAAAFQALPEVWFVEPAPLGILRGCADHSTCGNPAPYNDWIDLMNMRQAWCEPRRSRVILFDVDVDTQCGLGNLEVIHADNLTPGNLPGSHDVNYHGTMQAIASIGTEVGLPVQCVGSGNGSPGRIYLSGDGNYVCAGQYCQINHGGSFTSNLTQKINQDNGRDGSHAIRPTRPGDIITYASYLGVDTPYYWGLAKAALIHPVAYNGDGSGQGSQSPYPIYNVPAVTLGDADGHMRHGCVAAYGVVCAIPTRLVAPYSCLQCNVWRAADVCDSSIAAPILAGLLSIGGGNGMQKLNAMIRSCSNYPSYNEGVGFGAPDACRYLQHLDGFLQSGQDFQTTVQPIDEGIVDTPWGAHYLNVTMRRTGLLENHGLPVHYVDLTVIATVHAPSGDKVFTESYFGYPFNYDPYKFKFWLKDWDNSWNNSDITYDVYGRIGYNWVNQTMLRP